MKTGKQSGLSLIELMIALVIGMFLVLGILYVYSSSRAAYVTNDAGARVQEDGRFAFERLVREIRMAGYMGCANALDLTPNVITKPKYTSTFAKGDGLRVYDNGTGWVNPTAIPRVDGTDVIVSKRIGDCIESLTGNMGTDNANIQIAGNACNWVATDVLMISDCSGTDVFAATNVSSGSAQITIAHASDENLVPKLAKAYGVGAIVGKFQQITYFIGVDPANEQPALYEVVDFGKTDAAGKQVIAQQAVVGNVYDLQASVNLDEDADGDVDKTSQAISATTSWPQVISVNLTYRVRSEDANAGTAAQTYTYNGAEVSDRRIRRDFNSVVGIRNRLP